MKIKITQEHITNGTSLCPKRCPIALALIAAGFCNVHVCTNRVGLDETMVSLPDEATRFISHFDRGFNPQPFEFEFEGNV